MTLRNWILLSATALATPAMAYAQDTAAPAASAPTSSEAPASAESAVDEGDEIVVTAQKRAENVQDVPISMLAFSGSTLTQAGITNPGDLQRIAPTFRFTSSIGTLAARFSIRGIGTFSNSALEPSVATFIDGIYIPRPASIVNSLLDIQSVEVLSGPQGTLFGRNASVGALSFHTGQPENQFSASLKSDYSTGNRFRTEGMINVPVSEITAIRFAGLVDLFGGFWHDDLTDQRFGGIDTYQGRLSIKSELSSNLTWTVRGDYQQNKGDGLLNAKLVPSTLTEATLARLTATQGGIAPNLDQFGRSNNSFNGNATVDDSIWGVSSDLSFNTESDFTLRLLNGYYDWNSRQSDGDTASLSVYVLGRDLRYQSKSHSHELQFISPKDKLLDGRLDFVGGLYYFHEDLSITQDSLNGSSFCSVLGSIQVPPLFGTPGIPGATAADRIATCLTYQGPSSRGDFDQSTRSLAGYAQATFEIVPSLELTGGIRYTDEKKSGAYIGTVFNPSGNLVATNETTNLRLKDDRLTWRANLAWHPAEDVMVFGTVSTGFKSGGFNNGVATRSLGQARVFQPETITNYELGFKSQFADNMVTLNATAFRMDISNFQERSIIGLISSIRNVGKVRQQGFELDTVVKPVQGLRLNAAVTYLDSNITKYCNAPLPPFRPTAPASANCPGAPANTQDLKGARLNYTPKWSGVVGATIDGDIGSSGFRWSLNTDMNFTSSQKQGTTIDNGDLTVQRGYALLNARVTVYGPEDRWSVGVYARNLSDKGYCASTVYQVLEGPLGLRYDSNLDGVNDGTAVRCNLGAPRVIGVAGSVRF